MVEFRAREEGRREERIEMRYGASAVSPFQPNSEEIRRGQEGRPAGLMVAGTTSFFSETYDHHQSIINHQSSPLQQREMERNVDDDGGGGSGVGGGAGLMD